MMSNNFSPNFSSPVNDFPHVSQHDSSKWSSFIARNAVNFPDKTALIIQSSGRRLTYRELYDEIRRWVSYLAVSGVKPGDRIALLAANSLEHITILFACAESGAIFVPLNFRLSAGEIHQIIDRVEPAIIFTDGSILAAGLDKTAEACEAAKTAEACEAAETAEACEAAKTAASCEAAETVASCEAAGAGQVRAKPAYSLINLQGFKLPEMTETKCCHNWKSSPDSPLLMLFTSGSTGVPKGVMLHGKMLSANQDATIRNWGLLPEDITLVETPFFHTGGYNVLCLPLLKLGGTVILAESFQPDNVFRTFDNERVSVYFAVPTMFQLLKEHPHFQDFDFRHIRFLISGGAAISVELIHSYMNKGIMFKQGFGLTEVGPNCFLLKEQDALRKAGSIGQPMPHSEVMVLCQDGSAAGPNEPGELLIRGPHVCLGYFREAERFAESLYDSYFRTGDLVQYDSEGFFYVTGRIKDMYVSGGENIYPGEVEQKLKLIEGVEDAVVVSVPDPKWGEVGYAFLRSSRNISLSELREFLTPFLSRYKHPHHLNILSEFPTLANGKTDRHMLKNNALKAVTGTD